LFPNRIYISIYEYSNRILSRTYVYTYVCMKYAFSHKIYSCYSSHSGRFTTDKSKTSYNTRATEDMSIQRKLYEWKSDKEWQIRKIKKLQQLSLKDAVCKEHDIKVKYINLV